MKTIEQIQNKLKDIEVLAIELGNESNEKLLGTIDGLKWVLKDEENVYEDLNDYTGKIPDNIKIDIEKAE